MKLIVDECPKCGAPLKVRVKDKHVECVYCRAVARVDRSDEYRPPSPPPPPPIRSYQGSTQFLSFCSEQDVAAGSTLIMTQSVPYTLQLSSMALSRVVAPYFTIQLEAQRTILADGPGDFFAPDSACYGALAPNCLCPGDQITLKATNVDSVPHRFMASLGCVQPRQRPFGPADVTQWDLAAAMREYRAL